MDEWMTIRRRVLVEGVSKRQVLRETGMHWSTLEKILAHNEPAGYRRSLEPVKPKIGPHLGWIAEILAADRALPRKQRHTAKSTKSGILAINATAYGTCGYKKNDRSQERSCVKLVAGAG